MQIIKTLFLILLATAIPIALYASDSKTEKRIKEFKEEYKGIYIVDGTDIYIQRVIDFPNTSKEELTQMVKNYFNKRIEQLGERVSSSNIEYGRENNYFLVEHSPTFKQTLGPGTIEVYTYKIEIKENRIRATITLKEVINGPQFRYLTQEYYPFVKGWKEEKKHMRLFADYALSILDNIKADMQDELLDDNW